MKLLLGFFAICLPALVFADVVTVQNCDAGPLPSTVDVSGCREVPCELPKGKEAGVLVDFTATQSFTSLRPQVSASFGSVTVPYELPADRQNACDWLVGSKCPVSQGEDVTYELRMPVSESYPSLSLTVQLQLVDQDAQVVACFRLPANVV